ncbi:MAG TPA: hypothetical protein VFE65_12935 [Pseudonocardia sp.]|nr:hypothetical protein [Pseudonocardia sp.]
MREQTVNVALNGVLLPEARTGEPLDLCAHRGVRVLTLIRHRF